MTGDQKLWAVFMACVALTVSSVSGAFAYGMTQNSHQGSHLIQKTETYGYSR